MWYHNLAVGIFGSLIASVVFYFISELVFNEFASKNLYDSVNDLSEKMKGAQAELNTLNKYKRDGLERIELIAARETKNDLWIDLLDKSNKELDIISHTLSPWFEKTYADKFRSQIKRIIENDGNV